MAETIPCDLHVLSMPPAFALSQDQTLRFIHAKPHIHPKADTEPNTSEQQTHKPQNQTNQPIQSQNKHPSIYQKRYTNKHPPQPRTSIAKAQPHQPTDPKTHKPTTNQTQPHQNQIPPTHMRTTHTHRSAKGRRQHIPPHHQIQLSMNVFLAEAPVGHPVGGGAF